MRYQIVAAKCVLIKKNEVVGAKFNVGWIKYNLDVSIIDKVKSIDFKGCCCMQ